MLRSLPNGHLDVELGGIQRSESFNHGTAAGAPAWHDSQDQQDQALNDSESTSGGPDFYEDGCRRLQEAFFVSDDADYLKEFPKFRTSETSDEIKQEFPYHYKIWQKALTEPVFRSLLRGPSDRYGRPQGHWPCDNKVYIQSLDPFGTEVRPELKAYACNSQKHYKELENKLAVIHKEATGRPKLHIIVITKVCWPEIELLGEIFGLAPSVFLRHLTQLEEEYYLFGWRKPPAHPSRGFQFIPCQPDPGLLSQPIELLWTLPGHTELLNTVSFDAEPGEISSTHNLIRQVRFNELNRGSYRDASVAVESKMTCHVFCPNSSNTIFLVMLSPFANAVWAFDNIDLNSSTEQEEEKIMFSIFTAIGESTRNSTGSGEFVSFGLINWMLKRISYTYLRETHRIRQRLNSWQRTAEDNKELHAEGDAELRKYQALITQFQRTLEHLESSINEHISLAQPASRFTNKSLTGLRYTLVAIKELREDIELQLRISEKELQLLLTNIQIDESRSSIRQNDQVRKLTILAFIFVPISAISSIFGMNVIEFQTHTPSLATFRISAGSVTGFVLLVALFPLAYTAFNGYLRARFLQQRMRFLMELTLWERLTILPRRWMTPSGNDGQRRPLWLRAVKLPIGIIQWLRDMFNLGRLFEEEDERVQRDSLAKYKADIYSTYTSVLDARDRAKRDRIREIVRRY